MKNIISKNIQTFINIYMIINNHNNKKLIIISKKFK